MAPWIGQPRRSRLAERLPVGLRMVFRASDSRGAGGVLDRPDQGEPDVLIRSSTPGRGAFWRLVGIAVGAWALTILAFFGYEAVTLRASRDDVDYRSDPAQPLHLFHMNG